ncbi:MAG: hypothetical protein Q4G17_08425, partial [Staphylococcus xylosus]|nr:hypothetical protein [Staphylococcus xylosus]
MIENKLEKRHSKWYERLFFSTTVQIGLMVLFCGIFPALILWGMGGLNGFLGMTNRGISLSAVILACVGIGVTLQFLMKYPGDKSSSFIFSTVLSWYALILLALFLFRLDYAVYLILFSFFCSILFCFAGYFLSKRWRIRKIAYIPFGKGEYLIQIKNIDWRRLETPSLDEKRYDAIAVDLHSPELSTEWQRFLAQCTLNGIPVYNARQLEESLIGRVKIHHLYENDLGSLLPSPVYSVIKRLLDLGLVLLVFPL